MPPNPILQRSGPLFCPPHPLPLKPFDSTAKVELWLSPTIPGLLRTPSRHTASFEMNRAPVHFLSASKTFSDSPSFLFLPFVSLPFCFCYSRLLLLSLFKPFSPSVFMLVLSGPSHRFCHPSPTHLLVASTRWLLRARDR